VLNAALYTLSNDILKDFAPIALLTSNPQIVVTRKTLPASDLAELIAWLRANPDKATAGSAGAVATVSIAFFQQKTGTRLVTVPYRGAAPAAQDLMGGQIDLMFDQASNALPQIRTGAIKAFAVTARTRMANAPEIPTVDEAGLPGFYAGGARRRSAHPAADHRRRRRSARDARRDEADLRQRQ
jgi:tripartite-type tricarboxylate transporter receptor subunit TctC